jgi:aryl-alcohol dehydrogenase-like predicted oxidoreductase
MTTWDTANVYSNGYSERIIGNAMHKVCLDLSCIVHLRLSYLQLNIPRHRITILTKCGRLVLDDPSLRTIHHPHLKDQRNYVNQSGLSRQAILNQVNASLERLQTDYIDLLQIHRADLENVPAEVMSPNVPY